MAFEQWTTSAWGQTPRVLQRSPIGEDFLLQTDTQKRRKVEKETHSSML